MRRDSSLSHEESLQPILDKFHAGEEFISGYLPAGQLDRGGMGLVLPAIETALGRKVAVKFVAPGRSANEQIERFEDEMRMLAACSHQSIVSVFVAQLRKEPRFFTMPWVNGVTFDDFVFQHGRLQPKVAARLLREVALGIQHANELGILHRDLKPSNVMLQSEHENAFNDIPGERESGESASTGSSRWEPTVIIPVTQSPNPALTAESTNRHDAGFSATIPESKSTFSDSATVPSVLPGASNLCRDELTSTQIKILDFGLAQTTEQAATAQSSGGGTLSYISPEQLAGQNADTRTDVFGIGGILYFALSGKPVHAGRSFSEISQAFHQGEEVTPLRSHQPEIDRGLAAICHKCLATDRSQRYESAQAIADDLQAYLTGRPITAIPTPPAVRAWMWCKRNRTVAAFLSILVFVSILAFVLGVLAYQEGKRSIALAEAENAAHQRAENSIDGIRDAFLNSEVMLRPEQQEIYSNLVVLLFSWYQASLNSNTRTTTEKLKMADNALTLADTLRKRANTQDTNQFLRSIVDAYDELSRLPSSPKILEKRIHARRSYCLGLLRRDDKNDLILQQVSELKKLCGQADTAIGGTLARHAIIEIQYGLTGRKAARELSSECQQLVKTAEAITIDHPDRPYHLARALKLASLCAYKGGWADQINLDRYHERGVGLLEQELKDCGTSKLAQQRASSLRSELAKLLSNRGMILKNRFRNIDGAEELNIAKQRVISIFERAENIWRMEIARDPLNYEARISLAKTLWNRADLDLNFTKEPVDDFRIEAIAIYRFVQQRQGKRSSVKEDLAVQHLRLAYQQAMRGNTEASIDNLRSIQELDFNLINLEGPGGSFIHASRTLLMLLSHLISGTKDTNEEQCQFVREQLKTLFRDIDPTAAPVKSWFPKTVLRPVPIACDRLTNEAMEMILKKEKPQAWMSAYREKLAELKQSQAP